MATNYKKLQWGTNTPNTVAWVSGTTTTYPGLVKWSSDVVFARAVDFDFTTKTGISSFTYALAAYSVPSTVTRDGYYFWGDTLTVTANLATWWTATQTSVNFAVKDSIPLNTSTAPTVYVRYSFSVSRTPREVTVMGADVGESHSASIYTQYYDLDNLYKTLTITGSQDLTVWAGQPVTVSVGSTGLWYEEGVLYDEMSETNLGKSYTFTAGTDYIYVAAYPIPGARTLTINKTDPFSQLTAITAAYTRVIDPHTVDAATQATTKSVPTNTAVTEYEDLYYNSSVNLTATIDATNASYMNLTTTSTYSTATTNNCIFTITAAAKTRTLKYVQSGDSSAFNVRRIVYKDPSTGSINTATPTESTNYTIWQGEVPVYNITANTYYTISFTEEGFSKGTQTVTLTAAGQAKTRNLLVTLNEGVNKLSWATTTAGKDSGSASTTGTYNIQQPYTYSYAITTANDNYWSANSIANTAPGSTTVTVTASATRLSRNLTVTWPSHTSAVTITYTPTTSNASATTANPTVTPTTSGSSALTVFRGATVDVSASAVDYYTVTSIASSNWGPSTQNATAVVNIGYASRKLTFTTYSTNLSSATVWYTDTSNTRVSSSTSGTFTDVWQGAAITYTATAASYYTTSIVSSNLGATTSTIAVLTISATPTYRNLTLNVNSTILGHNYVNEITVRTGSSSGAIWRTASFDAAATTETISVPQPYSLYYSASANMDSYYTIQLSATTAAPGSSALTLAANAVRMTRTLTVNINNRDKATGSIIATYGSLSSATTVSSSFAINSASTSSSTTIDIWRGNAVSYTYSNLDTTNYTVYWQSANTSIGTSNAAITATIYARSINHYLSVWPSGAASWYLSSSSGTTWVSPGTATTRMWAARYATIAYAGTSATTCTITVYSMANQWTYQIKAATANYKIFGLSTKPTVGPTTAATFTAYIGLPVVLIFSGTQRVPYGFSTGYTSYTYYPTSGTSPSTAVVASIPLTTGTSTVVVNGAQTTQFKFTRKSSYWTMIVNSVTRSAQTYTYSSTYSATTYIYMDAYRNSTTGMSYRDGWHAIDVIADSSDGQTAIGSATIYNDTSSSVTFSFRLSGTASDQTFTSDVTTVTISAKSSRAVEIEYDTGSVLDEFGFEGKSSYETSYTTLAGW